MGARPGRPAGSIYFKANANEKEESCMKLKTTDILMTICVLGSTHKIDILSYIIWGLYVIYMFCRFLDWEKKK